MLFRSHFGIPADFLAGGAKTGSRHGEDGNVDLVWRASRSEFADRVSKSAGGDVCLLFEECHVELESLDDLSRHGAVHGDPSDLLGTHYFLAGRSVVVAAPVARLKG